MGRPARGDFASHRIEHSLSAIFDVPHGTGLAIIMPAWMEYVYRDAEPVFERLAASVFGIRDGEDRALRGHPCAEGVLPFPRLSGDSP